jgi:hypothetical protein
MAQYRLYCFDGADKVWTADWIEADSDEEAIHTPRTMETGVKCEVWQAGRLVATVASGGTRDRRHASTNPNRS